MQSESGAFVQGDTSEVSIIVYKGMEYKISLCSPSHPQLNGSFEFKIVEHITNDVFPQNFQTKHAFEEK